MKCHANVMFANSFVRVRGCVKGICWCIIDCSMFMLSQRGFELAGVLNILLSLFLLRSGGHSIIDCRLDLQYSGVCHVELLLTIASPVMALFFAQVWSAPSAVALPNCDATRRAKTTWLQAVTTAWPTRASWHHTPSRCQWPPTRGSSVCPRRHLRPRLWSCANAKCQAKISCHFQPRRGGLQCGLFQYPEWLVVICQDSHGCWRSLKVCGK